MSKSNGKDEAQQAAGEALREEAQQIADQQPGAEGEEPQRLPIMALVVINPQNGQLMLQINENIVQDRMAFFMALSQLGMGNAMNEHQKAQTSKILVPERKVLRV